MQPLKSSLPPNRTLAQVWNHYQVESVLALRLKASTTREQRSAVFATMYDELFRAVPDHPRLTRRADPEATARANRGKAQALRRWVRPTDTVLEFAPGDCEFSAMIAAQFARVIGVDISDQRQPGRNWPANFDLVVYDGYSLPTIAPGSIDVIFSDQLLEHLHPDDAKHHLKLCFELLKPGGRYVLRTPHADSGPWDVSRYFCDEPEGFHLKEWTYRGLRDAMLNAGFARTEGAWNAREICRPMPMAWFTSVERIFSILPKSLRRKIIRPLIPTLLCVGIKAG
jgi:SAM-dependent methyltransferase